MPGQKLHRVQPILPATYLVSFGSCVAQSGFLRNLMVLRAQAVIAPLVCDLHSSSFNPVVLCLRAHFGCRSRLGSYKEKA